jgi:hypothetical protein
MESHRTHAHALLEDALMRVREIDDPKVDRSELAQLVSSSLHQLYRAIAAVGDPSGFADALAVAGLELERAMEILSDASDPAAARLREVLADAATRARTLEPPAPGAMVLPTPDVWRGARASIDVPVVLDPPRDLAFPAIPVPARAPEPKPIVASPPTSAAPTTIEEIDAMLADASSIAAPPSARKPLARPNVAPAPPSVSEHLRRLSETMIEELGVFGLLRRRHSEGQTWTAKSRVEKRLLARVDAIVSCGSMVLPSLVRKLEVRPVPDAELTWALVYLFGSIAGDDMIDEAVRLARSSALDEAEVREAVADAMAMAPNVRIESRVRAWLGSESADERAVAIRALARRGALTAAELQAAVTGANVAILREISRALATVSGRVDERTIEDLLHHDDELVVRAALLGCARTRHPAGIRRARALVRADRGGFADAAIVCALSERRDAFEMLIEAAAVSASPVLIAALGWFGHADAIGYLMGRLEGNEEETQRAAAGALARICSSPEPRAPSQAPALPRSLVLDPKPWRVWWRSAERNFDAGVRYRFGAPWRASTNLWELEREHASPRERSFAYLELLARFAIGAPFEPSDFVARQRQQLAALAERVQLATGTGWPVQVPIA